MCVYVCERDREMGAPDPCEVLVCIGDERENERKIILFSLPNEHSLVCFCASLVWGYE